LALDSRQRIWLGIPGEGLFQVDRATGVFTSCHSMQVYDGFSGREITGPSPEHVLYIEIDPDGVLWIAGRNGEHRFGLYAYDHARSRWSFYPFYWKTRDGKKMNSLGINCLIAGNDNRYIWIGNYSGVGLLRLDKRQGRWKQYLLQTQRGAPLPENYIGGLQADGEGRLWLGTDGRNVLFDMRRETFTAYAHRPDDATTLPRENGYRVLTDASGITWFEISESGSSLTKKVPAHQFFKDRGQRVGLKYVFGIWKDPRSGNVFYAINKHSRCVEPMIVRIEAKNGRVTARDCREIPRQACESTTITGLQGDPSGRFIWVTTASGLFRLDPHSLKLTAAHARISNSPRWTTDSLILSCIAIDSKGRIWVGTRDGGLLLSENGGRNFYLFSSFDGSPQGLRHPGIRALHCDRKGRVWIAYWFHAGVSRFEPADNTFTHFIEKPGNPAALQRGIVFDFAETDDGRLWLSYEQGLCFVDARDEVNTVPAFIDIIPRRVVTDRQQKLWLSTNTNKLLRYDPESARLLVFDYRNGFVGNSIHDQLYAAADGELFFADQYRWRPEALRRDSTAFHVVFTRFRIFEKDTFFGRDLNYLQGVTLRHDQNFFAISFAGLALADPAKNTYAYRLEGLEADWVQSGTRREASYTNLAPGRYTFRVKAANEDGVWTSTVISLPIEILPAWWQKTWFRMLVALAAAAVGARLYRYHLAQVRARAEVRQLRAEFRQRLTETEMAALRAQMNPHFLFNVMNSINLFLLENDAAAASVYLTKFSRLIRLVLENSRSEKVTLEKELEALRLYLDMETLRFKQKVRYEIDLEPDIDLKYTCIPPLLLQPYVENSIWHGLLHKKGGGTVTIRLRQPDENLLHVEITDDGIGRAASAARYSKTVRRHKSYGMQVTKERLAMINELYGIETKVAISDLTSGDGLAAGTRVCLVIPV
jgi:ligand-binding sensor domain-containing protein